MVAGATVEIDAEGGGGGGGGGEPTEEPPLHPGEYSHQSDSPEEQESAEWSGP